MLPVASTRSLLQPLLGVLPSAGHRLVLPGQGRALPAAKGVGQGLLLAGKGAVPAGSATRRPFGPCRCPPPSAVALAWPDDKLRCVCGPKHPRWLQDVLAAGHSSRSFPWVAARGADRASRTLPGSRTRSPRPSRRRQDRQRAAGVGAAEPVRSSGDSRYIFTANPAGPASSIQYPIRTAAPLVLRRQQDRCRRTCPSGGITTALVDPDGSGLVTKAIPDPTLYAWWEALIGTVAWCQSCGTRARPGC